MLVWLNGKGPAEEINFDVDWTIRLAGDTITSSSWEIVGTDPATPEQPVTLQIMTDANHLPYASQTATGVWVEGGTLGITYVLQNTIHTASGVQPLSEMIELPMRNR